MKHLSLLLLISLSLTAQAQEVVFDTNYYAPPPVIRERVISADPDQNDQRSINKRQATIRRELLNRYLETHSWYVSAEGGLRSDGSLLSTSLDHLVSNPTQTKIAWSGLVGYTYRNAWSIETGYSQAPIHLTIMVANGRAHPLIYTYQNNGYGIPLRIKRRIGLGNRAANGTGFWLLGGAWLVPNGAGQTGNFRLTGTRSPIRLTDTTTIANRITGLAELGVDYATRLSPTVELGIYGRMYWGMGHALQSTLYYVPTGRSTQQATLTADGTGWGAGLVLRYIYGKQQILKINARRAREKSQ